MSDPAVVAALERIAAALEAIADRDVKPEKVDEVARVVRPLLTSKASADVQRAARRRRVAR